MRPLRSASAPQIYLLKSLSVPACLCVRVYASVCAGTCSQRMPQVWVLVSTLFEAGSLVFVCCVPRVVGQNPRMLLSLPLPSWKEDWDPGLNAL